MDDDSAPLLDQVLRPSPPLSPRVLLMILGVVVVLNLAIAAYFLARGAWPVTPFLGLDVALLAWAFRASTRAAQREERVTLTRESLHIARRFPRKAPRDWTFNPYWVRVEMDVPHDHWSPLTLWSHGKFLAIGAFLAPDERAAFAQKLKNALRDSREIFP